MSNKLKNTTLSSSQIGRSNLLCGQDHWGWGILPIYQALSLDAAILSIDLVSFEGLALGNAVIEANVFWNFVAVKFRWAGSGGANLETDKS